MKNLALVTVFIGALAGFPAYGQVPISGLPAASVPTSGSDIAPIVQGGITKKIGVGNMLPPSGVTPGTYGDSTHCPSFTVIANGTVTGASQSTSCPGSGGGSPPAGATNTVQINGGGGNFGAVGPGTSTTVLHGNASGPPSYSSVAVGTDVSGLGTGVAAALALPVSGTGAICLVTGGGCTGGGGGPALNGLNVWTGMNSATPVVITPSSATYTPNGQKNNYTVALGSNCPCTLANFTATPVAGTEGTVLIQQDGTGGRTISTWGSTYFIEGGTSAISLSSGASAIDIFSYHVIDATHVALFFSGKGISH